MIKNSLVVTMYIQKQKAKKFKKNKAYSLLAGLTLNKLRIKGVIK